MKNLTAHIGDENVGQMFTFDPISVTANYARPL
jgi:hypothetical protein